MLNSDILYNIMLFWETGCYTCHMTWLTAIEAFEWLSRIILLWLLIWDLLLVPILIPIGILIRKAILIRILIRRAILIHKLFVIRLQNNTYKFLFSVVVRDNKHLFIQFLFSRLFFNSKSSNQTFKRKLLSFMPKGILEVLPGRGHFINHNNNLKLFG